MPTRSHRFDEGLFFAHVAALLLPIRELVQLDAVELFLSFGGVLGIEGDDVQFVALDEFIADGEGLVKVVASIDEEDFVIQPHDAEHVHQDGGSLLHARQEDCSHAEPLDAPGDSLLGVHRFQEAVGLLLIQRHGCRLIDAQNKSPSGLETK